VAENRRSVRRDVEGIDQIVPPFVEQSLKKKMIIDLGNNGSSIRSAVCFEMSLLLKMHAQLLSHTEK
jgi:hypothetical protein